ncbi:Uncharacterised protein [uncultured Clostridium sp.]|nr:Uncharacterised protein [uncultured Clostridium sp.]
MRGMPDPQIYSQYSSYGVPISEDGEQQLYNGQRVRHRNTVLISSPAT